MFDWAGDYATFMEYAWMAITVLVMSSAALSTILDSDNNDPIIDRVLKVIDILAFNWGKAKNADAKGQPLDELIKPRFVASEGDPNDVKQPASTAVD